MRARPSSVTSAARAPSGLSATDRAAPTSKLAQRVKTPGTSAAGGGNMNVDGSGRHENGSAVAGGGMTGRRGAAAARPSIAGQSDTDAPAPEAPPPIEPCE